MNANYQLDYIEGIPAKCPVIGCPAQLPPQQLLAHLLMLHRPEDSMQELGDEWQNICELDLFELSPGSNHVVDAIAYAGSGKANRSRPIGQELQLLHHLPILVMLYVRPPKVNVEQQYILYLVAPVASRRVRAHVSLLSEWDGSELRGMRCLRNYLDAPLNDSEELLHCNMDYLIYKATDVWKHSTAGAMCTIQLSVVLLGEPNLFEVPDDQQEQSA
ncbi:uncharacterized protein LOC6570065 [Drosophila grimshawi]|uniref:GH25113 n=1 Tax=Drosophila grimshawi TaxID=7222 RepID=B4JZC3_DROGR|nr:uncharacterized protein LOC6570065 [Drosophila grimshawi]EDV94045.1 GH25113 [Drosophila grimshawi]